MSIPSLTRIFPSFIPQIGTGHRDTERRNVLGGVTAEKVRTVALMGIALYAVSNIPKADAGPALYAACVVACEAAAAAGTLGAGAAAALIFCVEGCWPALAAPTP